MRWALGTPGTLPGTDRARELPRGSSATRDRSTTQGTTMKLLPAFLGLAMACSVPIAANAQQTEAASTTAANPLPDTDRDFVQAASMSGSTEIDAAKLAMHNTKNKDVHAFAQHMIVDHTKLAAQLKFAAPHGVTVPTDNSDTSIIDSLRPLKDQEFDRAYAQKVGVEGHKEAMAAFQKEISDGQNASLKTAARKALPTIEEHYRMAQSLARKVGAQP